MKEEIMSNLPLQVIQVNHYALDEPPDVYVAAIKALAKRTETEGHSGVLGYKFFVNASDNTAGAVITYANADAWLGHHQLAYQWDEMVQLQATVSLKRVDLFGPLNDEVRAFMANVKLKFDHSHYDELAAGFVRR
jgi:hypothetical protein